MIDPLIALPASFVEMRQKHIATYGARSLDIIVGQGVCEKCGPQAAGFATNTACDFHSFAEFEKTSAVLCEKTAKGAKGVRCPECSGPLQQSWVHYHSYHEGRAADLVHRWMPKQAFFGRSTTELLWWNPHGGFTPATQLTGEDEARFVRDCSVRAVQAAFEMGDAQTAVNLFEGVATRYPADPALIAFIPNLLGAGYGRPSLKIAEMHAGRYPDQAEGHSWVGETLFQCISHRLEPETRLADARRAFERARELDPRHVQAALGLGNVLRALKQEAEAQRLYESLADQYPDLAEVRFNLGTLLVERDPSTALKWFEDGARLDATDPDYPVGLARALLRLGRKDEARQALRRAKALSDRHPRYEELEASLAAS
ncbi:MAG: tetratricopeptide repeat protein [Myxococcaceae bacterium]